MAPVDPGTRERLLLATRQSIRDLGLPATTARQIVGRAGANLAAIPYHFGSKDALVTEALVAEARELIGPVFELLGSDRAPTERATAAVVLLNELFETNRGQVPVYLAALAATPHTPGVSDELAVLWREVRGRLAADVAAQRDAGLLAAWVDPEAMAALILALVNGVVVAAAVDPEGPGHRAVASQFLALLLSAFAGPPGRDGPGEG